MIVHRRTWLYRLPGQPYAQIVSFDRRVTAVKAREFLRRKVGDPLELWARSVSDVKQSSSERALSIGVVTAFRNQRRQRTGRFSRTGAGAKEPPCIS